MAEWKRRKKSKLIFEKEEIWCSVCHENSIISYSHVIDMVCGDCFVREMMKDELVLTKSAPRVKFKRGWNLHKKYVAPNGDVYSYGKLQKVGKKRDRNTTAISKKN